MGDASRSTSRRSGFWPLVLALGMFGTGAMAEPPVPGVVVEGSRAEQDTNADPVVNNLQRRTFRFFWEVANPDNGMVPDRWPSPSFASIAAVGFGLTAYVIGA